MINEIDKEINHAQSWGKIIHHININETDYFKLKKQTGCKDEPYRVMQGSRFFKYKDTKIIRDPYQDGYNVVYAKGTL